MQSPQFDCLIKHVLSWIFFSLSADWRSGKRREGVPGSRPGRGTVCCGLEQVTFIHCLVLVKPRKLTRTNCDEAGDYVVPNVLSPRDLVSRPDIMDETVLLSSFRLLKKGELSDTV